MIDMKSFVWMVKRMRALQRRYFQTRDSKLLNECRDEERRVDAAIAAILSEAEKGLFDG